MPDKKAELQSKFSRRLEEQLRLKRFFKKLLSEVSQLQATEVSFQLMGSDLTVTLMVDRQEVKCINIKSDWYVLIVNWLEQRWAPLLETCNPEQMSASRAEKFPVQIRQDNSVFKALLRRGKDSVTLYEIEIRSVSDAVLDVLGKHVVNAYTTQVNEFGSILTGQTGVIVVVVPDQKQLSRAVTSVLGLIDGFYGGDLKEDTVRKLAVRLAGKELILVSWVSSSIDKVIHKLSQDHTSDWSRVVTGVVGLGFLPALCTNCCYPTKPPIQLKNRLSPDLPTAGASYRKARGCNKCQASGLAGWSAMLQAKLVGSDLRTLMERKPDELVIKEYLECVELASFREQAIRLAYNGQITWETIVASPIEITGADVDVDDSLPVSDDYFTLHEEKGQEKLLQDARVLVSGVMQRPVATNDTFLVDDATSTKKKEIDILVVEDDTSQRDILSVVLGEEGYSVTTAENGLEALGQLKVHVPHLVITDLMMPKLNGQELVVAMKEDDRLKSIPILVLTVLNDSDREYALLDMGVDDYCEKTIQRKVLLKRVENLLKRFYTLE